MSDSDMSHSLCQLNWYNSDQWLSSDNSNYYSEKSRDNIIISVECRVSALTVAFMPLSGNGFATGLLYCDPEQSKRSQCLLLPHSPPSHKKTSFCRQQKFYIGLIIEQVLVSVGNKILFYSEGSIFVATVIALASLELSIKSRKCLPALYTLYF